MIDAIKLLQITDTHCYADDTARLEWMDVPIYPNHALASVLKQLKAQYHDYQGLLITGDLAQEEVGATYQRINELLTDFPIPVHILPGNHDPAALLQQYLSPQISQAKSIQYRHWHCLLLDTSKPLSPDGHLNDADYALLAQQLSAIPNHDYIAIFMHHQPLMIGSEWMDSMGLQNTERFWQLLQQFPQVQVIFHGHIHQAFSGTYVCNAQHSIQVFGTPATCVQLKPTTPHFAFDHTLPAWREIHLHANGEVTTQVHYLDKTPTPPQSN